MMQGDSYGIPVELKKSDGSLLVPEDIADLVISIGALHKGYKEGAVTYHEGCWIFPVTQAESFKFLASRVKAQARVQWVSGEVEGISLGSVNVAESTNKEVLEIGD